MIITGQNIFPIATQKNLSFNINFTPKDLSLSTISFKEGQDFNFTLYSGKFSDINNKSVYFYNTGENINLSGNMHHYYQNDGATPWSSEEKFLYDYYINGNPIILSGSRTGTMGGDINLYSKISGLTISGSNLELTNFQIFGVSPTIELNLAPSFTFGELITGFLKSPNTFQEECRILSGSVLFPTGFTLNSLPSRLTGLGIASGGFNINTNFNPQYSDIPLTYNVTLNLLTDFGLLSKSFITSGLPASYINFFINVNGAYFNLFNIPSGAIYNIEAFFTSGNKEYEKDITIEFNYATGQTGLLLDSTSFYGSGVRNFNLDIIVTGTGIFQQTGTGLVSGFINGLRIFGTGNLSGIFQTGIQTGNFQKQITITGSGIYNSSYSNLNTFIISGYRTGIWSSGIIVRSGIVTGYVAPFSGSGTAIFYNGFRSILNSTVPLGIIRDTRIFTGSMFYPLIKTGTVIITGFNSTFLDYSGNSAGTSLTGLLIGSGFVYSTPTNFTTTGILRSEVNNRRITGILNTQIVDFVLNTGRNLATVVVMVSGEATGNYLNNPNVFGLNTLGTGQNIVTGRNTIFGEGFITGINTGYIIKDNFITTGIVTGIFLYRATGNPNNIGDPINRIVDFYSVNVSGNIDLTGINLIDDILFTGETTSSIRFTGLIVQEGILYSNPINFTGLNTITYNSISGGLKTGIFIKVFDNTILEGNTYFTGSGLFSVNVFSTGLSSGVNWTYFNGSGGPTTNKIFTGFIYNGSGDIYNQYFPLAPFDTSGTASGQIGNFILNGPRFNGLILYTSILKDQFFTGDKIEFRQIIVSGIATGTKYNYQGLGIDYSGYVFSSGSGFLVGSGFIFLTGQGILTGTDNSTGTFSTTGETFILLTGNPSNIADPVNIHYKYYDNILSTGSGYYRIDNFGLRFEITGVVAPQILTGGAIIFEGGYIGNLITSSTGFYLGSGTNLASSFNSRSLFSGQIPNPSFTGDFFYFTGISNQILSSIVSGVMTGINDNPITGVTVIIDSDVFITGFITNTEFGSGVLEKYIFNTTMSGYAQDDIRKSLQRYTNQAAHITGVGSATGIYQITGVPRYLTGTFTGLDCFATAINIEVTGVNQSNGNWIGFETAGAVVVTGIFYNPYYTTGTVHLFNEGFIRTSGILTSGGAHGLPILVYDNIYCPGSPYTAASNDVFFSTGYIDFTGSGYFHKKIIGPTGLPHSNIFVTGTGVTGIWSSTGLYSFTSGVTFSSSNPIYSNGRLTGAVIGPPPSVFSETNIGYSGIQFYSIQNRGRRLFPITFNTPISGSFEGTLIGSGFMSQSKTSISTGKFYFASGILQNINFRTGYKDFNITGFFTSVNSFIDWTGNINTGLGIGAYYTGVTLLNEIRGRTYESDIFRTGFINLVPAIRFFETNIESQKIFFATGYINFRSGINFIESDQGKKYINGILLTGTGSVILPANVFPISSPNFSGIYDFMSTGTGFMTITGDRQIIISDLLTGVTGIWETTGFSNVTGLTSFISSNFGIRSLVLNYNGQAITGTLYPTKSVYPNLFGIRSGFNHITTNNTQIIRGSGLMTGFLQTTQGLNSRSGISGTLEFLGAITGFATGIVTGTSGIVPISITGGTFTSYVTIPFNMSNNLTGIFNFNKAFTRTGNFEGTGLALTTGTYQSKTNFLVSGLATGYFSITGTGIVNLTGFVIAPQIITSGLYDIGGPRNNLSLSIGASGTGINFPTTIIINHDSLGHGGYPIAWSGSNDLINWNDIVLFKIGYYNNLNAGIRAPFTNFTGFNRPFTGVTGLPSHGPTSSPSEIVTSGWRSTTDKNSLGIYSGELNYRYFRTSAINFAGGGTISGTITIINSPQITYDFTNYPYLSGNSIAYLNLTPVSLFSGDFRSGIRITGLYNKNYTGIFTGSISGSYTGMWFGTGTFTGSNAIPFFDTDFGVKNSYLVASNLINSGLESGLVPVFTIGLYSGLKTIGNIGFAENRIITGSGYFESIASGFGLAGTTSGSGIGLVTGYLSGLINKNYFAGINYETGLIITGYLSGNAGIVLTGIFTGTIGLTGRILRSFNLPSSGVGTGYYLATKTFTGGFELYTGITVTGEFIKINPTSATGWGLTTSVKTGQSFYVQINSKNIFDEISGYFNARVFSGDKAGSVDTNIIYASRLY